jgi:hypothetical protein
MEDVRETTLASYFRVSALVVVAVAASALLAVVLISHNPAAAALSTRAVPGTTIVVNTDQDAFSTMEIAP